MNHEHFAVIDCDTLNCFGVYSSKELAIEKGKAYNQWTESGFQIVKYTDTGSVTWGYDNARTASIVFASV